MNEILKKSDILDLFPIREMWETRLEVVPHGLMYNIDLCMSDGQQRIEMELYVPRPETWFDGHPIFEFFGVTKAIAYRAIPTPEFHTSNSLLDLVVQTPKEVLLDTIRKALTKSLDSDDPMAQAQRTIDSLFGSSDLIRNVDAHKPLDVEGGALTVVIDSPGNTNWEDYMYNDWEGIIDYTTGTQGEKIGHTFKLAEGCRVEDGKFVPSNKLFSTLMRRCVLFPENTRPNRLLITRPAFANHEELIQAEEPVVAHESYQNEFTGRHLITGILSLPDNYQDCLVISQSCANNLACWVRKRFTVQDTGKIEVLVSEGDHLLEGTEIANIYDQDNELVETIISPVKDGEWIINKIDYAPTIMGGERATRYRFEISTVYLCENGDKLTTRHGGKGVVKIKPDDEMPKLLGKALDIVVHPMSFNSRRNLGTFREMMVNKALWHDYKGQTLKKVKHFSQKHSMERLVKMGMGKNSVLDDGTLCFTGPLYWLRTDKHSREQCNRVTGHRHFLNQDDLKPNSGKISGKRMSMNYSTIMAAKGLNDTHKALVKKNIVPRSLSKIGNILGVLK